MNIEKIQNQINELQKQLDELKGNEFKVGDYVRVIDDSQLLTAYKIGDVAVVNNFFNNVLNITMPDGKGQFITSDRIKKISKADYELSKKLLEDGWLYNNGQEPDCKKVRVALRYQLEESEVELEGYPPSDFFWDKEKDLGDGTIIYYKPVEDDSDQYMENLKTEAELLELAKQYPVDWSDEDQIKRHFIYNYLGGELDWPSESIFRAQGTIYLTEIGIDKALEQIGEARLIKLIKSGI